MAGPHFASAEIDVDIDGAGVVAKAGLIGKLAGKAFGDEFGKSMNKLPKNAALSGMLADIPRDLKKIDAASQGTLGRLRRLFGKNKDINETRVAISGIGTALRGLGNASGLSKLQSSFSRMDSTVRLVLTLIAALGPQIAGLGSGVAAAGVSLLSYAFVALGGALGAGIPLAIGFGGAILLVTNGLKQLKKDTPAAVAGLTQLQNTFKATALEAATAFAPALNTLSVALSKALSGSNLGASLGAGLGQVAAAFTAVVNGPAFQGFLTAFTQQIPAAMASVGTGIAGVANAALTFFTAALPLAQQLGAQFAGWGTALANSTAKLASSGQLSVFFDTAKQSIDALLGVVGPLSRALGNVFVQGSTFGNAFLGTLGQLASQFLAFTQSAGGQASIAQWFQGGIQIMRALLPLVGAVGTALADMVTPTVISRVSAFLSSLTGFMPILGQLLSIIGQANVLGVLGTVLNAVAQAITPILPVLTELAVLVGQTLSGAVKAMAPLFKAFATALGTVAKALMPILPVIVQVVGALAQSLAPVMAVLGQAIAALAPVLAALLQGLAPVVTVLVSALAPIIKAIIPLITGLAPVVGALAAAFMPLAQTVASVATQLVTALMPVVMALLPIIQTLAPVIVQLAVAAFTPLLNIIVQLMPVLMPLINLVAQLVAWFLRLLQPVINAIEPFLEIIVQFISFNAAAGDVIGVLGKLGKWFTDTFGKIGTVVSRGWDTVVSFFKSAPTKAFNALTWLPGKLVSFFSSMWSRVTSVVSGAIARFLTFYISLPGKIVSAVESISSKLAGVFTRAWSAASQAVSRGFAKVLEFFRGIPEKLKSAVGNALTLLTDVGTNIVKGLLSGITGAWHLVTDKVSSLVDKIPGPIRKILGIKSPSRVFREIGKYISEGLAAGILDSSDDVVKATKKVASEVEDTGAQIVKDQANRIITARKEANDQIRSYNRHHKKDLDILPSYNMTEATAIAKKQLSGQLKVISDFQKKVAAQGKITKGYKTTKYLFAVPANLTDSKLTSKLNDQADDLASAVRRGKVTLADLAKSRDYLADKIKAANDNLAAAIKTRNDYRDQIISSSQQYASILNAASTGADDEKVTTASIKAEMNKRYNALKTFTANIASLTKAGLNKTTLEQLVSGGVDQSGDIAAALAAGGKSAISSVNTLQSKINTEAKKLGTNTSQTFYQAGVDAAKGIVNGLNSQDKALTTAMNKIATKMVNALKKKLGIKSPSRVLAAQVGVPMSQGIAKGVLAGRRGIDAAVAQVTGVKGNVNAFRTSGNGAANVPGKTVIVEEGAIQITTVVADPAVVARKALDQLVTRVG